MDLVFDSSILIDNLRGGIRFKYLFEKVDSKTRIVVPTIVVMEIFSGKSTRSEKQLKDAKKLLFLFEKVDLTEKIAIKAGELYRDISQTLSIPDYIIAATALEINAAVATLNKKHFSKIQNLLIYPI